MAAKFYNMPTVLKACFLAFVCVIALGAQAQDVSPAQQKLISEFPSPKEEGKEFYLTKDNVYRYQDLLLFPLVKLISTNDAIIRTQSRLDFAWRLTEDWTRASKANVSAYVVDEAGNITQTKTLANHSGYPFGEAQDLATENNPAKKASKILWNMALGMNPTRDTINNYEISWIGQKGLLRTSEGFVYTVQYRYPQRADEVIDNPFLPEEVMSRTVLKLLSPAVVFGFAGVSERYFGSREDQYWLYSPVLERSRKVISSNRGDPMVGELLTFDDLFVWSGKVQSVNAKVIAEKTVLAAFPSTKMYRLQEEGVTRLHLAQPSESASEIAKDAASTEALEQVLSARGQHKRQDSTPAAALWNYETKRFPQAAAWLPVTAVFVPRQVWVIELDPKDPYYASGRQVLFIDQQSFLPLYRLIYDQKGMLQRMVIGGWGLASTEDGTKRLPFSAFVLLLQVDGSKAVALTSHFVRTFEGKQTPLSGDYAKLLDIANHEKQNRPQQEQRKALVAEETGDSEGQASSMVVEENKSSSSEAAPED